MFDFLNSASEVPSAGQVAYEGYRKHSDGKSLVSGQEIPEWNKLPAEIQAAWNSAGEASARLMLKVIADLMQSLVEISGSV
jgi:hypothetical protein